MKENIDIKISDQPLNVQACYDFVRDDSCGGIALFVGTVRNNTQDKDVQQLDFSTYEPMAFKEMNKIAEQAISEYPIKKIAIHHAKGLLKIGEIPVIIAVSSAHREAAFEACQFAIDRLKQLYPFGRRNIFLTGRYG